MGAAEEKAAWIEWETLKFVDLGVLGILLRFGIGGGVECEDNAVEADSTNKL